jgi:hypothetical protein
MTNIFESSDGNRGINPNGMYTGGGILGNLKDYVVKPTTSTFDTLKLDQIIFGMQCKQAPCPSGEVSLSVQAQRDKLNKEIKEAQNLANKTFDALPVKKYIFNKDFNYSVWGIIEQKRTIKKGTILSGKQDVNGNITLVSDSSKSFDDFKNYQPMPDMPSPFVTVSSSEKDILTETSTIGNGLKELTNDPKEFYAKHKTHLLILAGIVLAYVVYKKK